MSYTFDIFLAQNPWRGQLDSWYVSHLVRDIDIRLKTALKESGLAVISGAPAAGKTNLAWALINDFVRTQNRDPKEIFYFSLEEPITRSFIQSAANLVNFLKSFGPAKDSDMLLVMDSAHYLAVPEKFFEELFKSADSFCSGLKIIAITNLASFGDKLVKDFTVKPAQHLKIPEFNFREFLEHALGRANVTLPKFRPDMDIIAVSKSYARALIPLFEEYVLYGGYPDIIRTPVAVRKVSKLQDILRDYHNKLAQIFREIKHPEKLYVLFAMLAKANGTLVNLKKLKQGLHLNHRTVARYLDILEDVSLFSLVHPFEAEKKTGIPFLYFADTGLRNLLTGIFNPLTMRPDQKVLLDNFVYNQLRMMGDDIRFYRPPQTDWVIFTFRHNDKLYGAAVADRLGKFNSRVLLSFIRKHHPHKVFLLHPQMELEQAGEAGGNHSETGWSGRILEESHRLVQMPVWWIWALPEALKRAAETSS
ncbi:MAG: ATP-binding protein [Planctomycetes bacterium]|nr:ATP-binding protein [Planctomycetota bacterium]